MAGDDPGYLAWLRASPCALAGRHPCAGPVQAHHSTHGRGMSQRTSDRSAFPLCAFHHRTFHDLCGYFNGWVKTQRQQWQDDAVFKYQKLYDKKEGIF
jgi:hypothetical protein